tara:strand:+ start:1343 stop:1504 length:162 start_codon:yes stop_codon:yes gene_type:complete
MFSIPIAILVIVCAYYGMKQGQQQIKDTREGLLPAAKPCNDKDSIVFLYTDMG